MEERSIDAILDKYQLTNLSPECKKVLRLYAQFGMLSIEVQEEEKNQLKFSFAKLCDNQKIDPFWRIVLSQVFNIEKTYNRINWTLLYDNLEENIKQKCSRCNLAEEEKCPFKVLANLMNLEKKENISFQELMEHILEEKHEIKKVELDLPIKEIDYISLKASEILIKNDWVKLESENEEEIIFSYLNFEDVQEQDFLPYIFKNEMQQDAFKKSNLLEELKKESDYFTQSPYRLAAYVLWFCKKEKVDVYSFFEGQEKMMKEQRDLYFYRNTRYIIQHMPYNEEVKTQLTNFVNFIRNNMRSRRKYLKIPLNMILYTTDNNIVQEVTSFLNGVIFYYNYVSNSKITNLSTNTIISDYRSIKRQYFRVIDPNTKNTIEPNLGMLLISDFGLLRHEKEDFRNRILNLLEESIENSSRDIITVLAGKKETIQEILAENQSLRHMFNICFDFKDLEENEVYEIVLKNIEKLRKD